MDALGRPTSITTPEGGTVTKTYDVYPSSCGTGVSISGKLMKTVFANGNFECYQYSDGGINRLTDIGAGYSGGGGTLCTRFRYDSTSKGWLSPPSGATISNVAGRLMEAETDNCVTPGNTSYTDEWYSYDADGNVTDIWESTPNSGGYYHSSATHYGNGALNAVTAPVNVTYGLDGEGRYSSSNESTQTEISGVTYNAASQPTTINIGTGSDYDGYTYDPYTGRMTNWTFQVNSVTETGALTWNQNGSLKQLVVTDGFNSGGAQTCYYNSSLATGTGYDDLGRLIGVSCGSSWAQAFSFDQYDNITKSGSVTWNPGYSPSTNRYSTTGCPSCTYDLSGNLTTDTINSYAWNQFNKLGSVNLSGTNCATGGQCLIYDATGRLVEVDSAGVASEIFYGHAGKYYMSGSTWTNTALNMPGGGLLARAFGWWIGHNDWLGSSRIVSGIATPAVYTDRAFAPYGEVYNLFGSSSYDSNFTGDSQDILAFGTCCYDTPNRELSANQGRFLSPDPAGSGWNQYAYPTNPNSMVDPSGLAPGTVCAVAHSAYGPPTGGRGYSGCGQDLETPTQIFGGGGAGPGTLAYANCPSCSNPGGGSGTVGADGGSSSSGNCSMGCVTTASIDTLDGQVVGGSAGDWSFNFILSTPVDLGDVPINPYAQAVFSQPALQTAASTMTDVRTYVLWTGGSVIEGLLLVPGAATAAKVSIYNDWLSFEYAFPGATADVIQMLTPPSTIPLTLPGAVVFGVEQVYDWYENHD